MSVKMLGPRVSGAATLLHMYMFTIYTRKMCCCQNIVLPRTFDWSVLACIIFLKIFMVRSVQ